MMSSEDHDLRLVTAEEVAIRLGVTRQRVYDMVRQGLVPSVRLGRSLRFSTSAIGDWIDRGGQGWAEGWRK